MAPGVPLYPKGFISEGLPLPDVLELPADDTLDEATREIYAELYQALVEYKAAADEHERVNETCGECSSSSQGGDDDDDDDDDDSGRGAGNAGGCDGTEAALTYDDVLRTLDVADERCKCVLGMLGTLMATRLASPEQRAEQEAAEARRAGPPKVAQQHYRTMDVRHLILHFDSRSVQIVNQTPHFLYIVYSGAPNGAVAFARILRRMANGFHYDSAVDNADKDVAREVVGRVARSFKDRGPSSIEDTCLLAFAFILVKNEFVMGTPKMLQWKTVGGSGDSGDSGGGADGVGDDDVCEDSVVLREGPVSVTAFTRQFEFLCVDAEVPAGHRLVLEGPPRPLSDFGIHLNAFKKSYALNQQ